MDTLGGGSQGQSQSCSWVTGSWGSCSCQRRCGTGVSKRSVNCVCTGRGSGGRCRGSAPASSRPCEERSGCSYSCSYTPFGLCDRDCRSRSRLGTCMLGPFIESNKRKCPGGCSSTTEACPIGAKKQGGGVCGPKCKWQAADFTGACSKDCGGGQRTRPQPLCVADSCRTFSEAQSLSRKSNPCAGQCSAGTKPATSESCNTQACKPKCKWQAQDFNTISCSATCGTGTQTRPRVLCVVDTCRTFAEAESLSRRPNPCAGQCALPAPATSQPCNAPACLRCKWQAADFSSIPCSVTCGTGTQTRPDALCVVDTCRSFAEAETLSRRPNPCAGQCALPAPATSQPCSGPACPLICQIIIGERFGPCSARCGGGIRSKPTYCIPDPSSASEVALLTSPDVRVRPPNPCAGQCAPVYVNETCNTAPCKDFVCEKNIKRQQEDTPPTGKWVLYTRTATSYGFFRAGPGSPPPAVPDNAGSIEFTTPGSGDKITLFNYDHTNQPLGSLTSILYDTFRTAVGAQPVVTSINIGIVGPTLPLGFSTLVFEPIYNTDQGALANNVWQQWDAFKGGAAIYWSSKMIPGAPLGPDSFVPIQQIIDENPGATISAIGLNQGSGNQGLISAVSYLKVTSGAGAFAYNFEAQCSRK